ncbi:thioesterase II family protein [Nocardia wallacei]|uniref:thioesterase II family protein n=1 Tax=Nocardia wallacei TaxID=480035 RepID=UPI0024587983|nr:thioesterase domain-containing protein [Nocardia wallacei]
MRPRTAATTDRSRWYWRFDAAARARRRVVCFPHAGGSAGYYRAWAHHVAADTELLLVQYPGRQERFREPCAGPAELGRAVAAELRERPPLPTVLFGHSMGASVAFETAWESQRCDRAVRLLIVSAAQTPARRRAYGVDDLDDAQLLARLSGLPAHDRQLLESSPAGKLFVSILRADLRALDDYRPAEPRTVDAGIVCFAGAADPDFGVADADGWQAHTTATVRTREFPGGHFYLSEQTAAVVGAVENSLRESAGAPDGGGHRGE